MSFVSHCIVLVSSIRIMLKKTIVLTGNIVRVLLRKTIVLSGRIVGVGVLIWRIVLGWRRTMIELIRLVVYLGLDLRSLMG